MSDVTSYLGFIGNDKAKEKFKFIIEELNKLLDYQSRDHERGFAQVLWDKKDLSRKELYELFGDLDQLFVNDEIVNEIYTQSSPRPPEKVVMKIAELLTQVDPKAIVTMTYFDDEPTFYGALAAFLEDDEIKSFDNEEWVQDDERVCWDHEIDDILAEYGSETKIRLWEELQSETTEMLESVIQSIKDLRDESA